MATSALTGVAAAVVLVGPSGGSFSRTLAVAAVVIAAALVALRIRRRAAVSALAAIVLAATTWASEVDGSELLRGVAIASAPLAMAFAGLCLGMSSRVAAVLVIVGGTVAGPVRALFDDPFLVATCSDCRHSSLAIFAEPTVALVLTVAGLVTMVGGFIVAAVRTPSIFRIALVVVVAAALPGTGLPETMIAATAVGIAVVAGAATVIDNLRVRRRLADWDALPMSGDELVTYLRGAFGDPDLTIEFAGPVGGDVPFVTADGEPAPPPGPGKRATRVDLGDQVVARIYAAPAALEGRRDTVLTPEVLVGIGGRRLTAALASRVRELQVSRARVVRRADEERRRLERDLHDGAQQHVLALGFDLRTALVTATDSVLRTVLERSIETTGSALDELREIAHGVYPPLLSARGIGPALEALGRRSRAPIRVGAMPGRLPTSVERGAYLLVADLAAAEDTPIDVAGDVISGRLVLTVDGSAAQPGALIAERIAAVGGRLTGARGSWRLELPCE